LFKPTKSGESFSFSAIAFMNALKYITTQKKPKKFLRFSRSFLGVYLDKAQKIKKMNMKNKRVTMGHPK
jgi:hypothetical protein